MEFKKNNSLDDYVITLLGYTKIKKDGSRHTNWFPWNRFKDVYETIGYKCEWIELNQLNDKYQTCQVKYEHILKSLQKC